MVDPSGESTQSTVPYITLDECSRLNAVTLDHNLVGEVLRFACMPEALLPQVGQQPLILWRPVAAANYETARFFQLADACGRPPLLVLMAEDRFTPDINLTKRYFAKLPIRDGKNFRNVSVVDFNRMRGRPFGDVHCIDGTPLIDFHRAVLGRIHGQRATAAVTDWHTFWRNDPPGKCYERLFAVLTCLGALADSFLTSGPETEFTQTIVLPAIEATIARFGARPRILRLLPEETEHSHEEWDRYPPEVLPYALQAARPQPQ